MPETKKKVMVGMSGGVDSAVTAILLQEQGYEVVGVTFRLWTPDDPESLPPGSCCSVDDVEDARQVCHKLGIPHYVMNYKDLFKEMVIAPFICEYKDGRTPNPCIACNRHIKFGDFYEKAKNMGFDYIATGHYSQIKYDDTQDRWRMKRASAEDKDQSYVLYSFTQEQLAATLMPLGEYTKDQVREIARTRGFVAASKKADSQDICFVPDGNYASFLEKHTGEKAIPGDFVDTEGNVLGEHLGISRYTIGQRRGLGQSFGKPMYVTKINPEDGTVELGDNEDLFAQRLVASDMNWIDFDTLEEPLKVKARIRYAHSPANATLRPLPDGKVEVLFENPQRAITPGQAVVFYDDENYVVGGGTIE